MIIPLHKKELKAALCCISNNPTRETLNHVLLEVRKGKMPLLVSTDGAVASIIECESSAGEEDFLSVLPRQFIKTIIEAKGSSSIELRINNGVANFFNGSIEFSCNLIEGSKFPKWRKIVPAESEDKSCNQISVSVELISKVCQVVKILTPEKIKPVLNLKMTDNLSPIEITGTKTKIAVILMPVRMAEEDFIRPDFL